MGNENNNKKNIMIIVQQNRIYDKIWYVKFLTSAERGEWGNGMIVDG